jgi:hypothetical protein
MSWCKAAVLCSIILFLGAEAAQAQSPAATPGVPPLTEVSAPPAATAASAQSQEASPIPPPLSTATARFFENHPAAWHQFLARLPRQPTGTLVAAPRSIAAAFGGNWMAVTAAPASGLCNPLLLTGGTVLVHECSTPYWYKLTPDITGSYVKGSWSQIAPLPVIAGTQYEPLYFASAVLPDGRVIIEGGEYNGSNTGVDTNLGAIYDPAADAWTPVSPPTSAGWDRIGDAPSIVLTNGVFLLGSCCAIPSVDALFDAATLGWIDTSAPADRQNEQGYTLLPNGGVLTIDVADPPAAEEYDPGAGLWSEIAPTPVSLVDPTTCGKFEIGPALTRPDGTVVAFGGDTGCTGDADPTAIYNSSNGAWTEGPDVPATCGTDGAENCTLADAPAAMLPNGDILFAASAGAFQAPTHFFEFTSGNAINQVADPLYNSSFVPSYVYNFLVLPIGQILETDFSAEVYTPAGVPNPAWAPVIASDHPSGLGRGGTYELVGDQFNGLSQGAAYGDDVQGATNYPLVRITNSATGHVFYAKTSGFNTMSIAPETDSSTWFFVPREIEIGAGTLEVVANGIASRPVPVTVFSQPSFELSVAEVGSGRVSSTPAGIGCPGKCSAQFSAGATVKLTARPATGWTGAWWVGACNGNGGCTVSMDSAQSVTVSFAPPPPQTLTVIEQGSGSIISSPAGIVCPDKCGARFFGGLQVSLTANPVPGWRFAGWSGACSGTGRCTVSMNTARAVSARFVQRSYSLRVAVAGQGTVVSAPSAIFCGTRCRGDFPSESVITLTAEPGNGWGFAGWDGACRDAGTADCTLIMSAREAVEATFARTRTATAQAMQP